MTLILEARRLLRAGGRNPTLATLPLIAFLFDIVTIVLTGVFAAWGRKALPLFESSADVTSSLTIAGPLMILTWLVVLGSLGAYRINALGAGTSEYSRVFNATLITAGIAGVGSYMTKFELSRGFYLLAFAFGLPVLMAGRFLMRRGLQVARRRGLFLQRVLISGTPTRVDEVAGVLRRERWLGYEIAGALTPLGHLDEETASGVPVVGSSDDLVKYATANSVDAVFLADGAVPSSAEMRRIVWDLENDGVQVVVAPSVADVSRERVSIRPVGGLPLVHIDPPTAARAARWSKRLFDVAVSAFLLIVAGPVFAWSALRIKVHDGGPVLFRQTRVGRNGREFSCLKFRTMVVDAEARLAELKQDVEEDNVLFKLKDDPRITGPGRWLRRFSLDELPQLVNVLRGDMSLVGPRPPLPCEVALYTDDVHRRMRVRPGMTGLWQVSGRSDLSWVESVRLDLYYVDNWSMLQDMTILSKTIGAVVRSRGAY